MKLEKHMRSGEEHTVTGSQPSATVKKKSLRWLTYAEKWRIWFMELEVSVHVTCVMIML